MICTRESEIVDALMAGRWPDACVTELREHAAACAICGDLVLVATAIAADAPRAEVPTSGVVWWRIQRRERQEAARVASRTLTLVQASSFVAAIAFVLTIVGSLSFSDTLKTWFLRAIEIINIPAANIAVLCFLVVTITLGPVALYFAVSKD
ncbi:MAG TPA: hypothetical protein VKB93_09855 [Thermoanaerobaculia bacterium]|nr:hypothetical protein [Thermoanaerobaculia bacterium]